MNMMRSVHFVLLVIAFSWGPWFVAIATGCSMQSTMGVVCTGLGGLGPAFSALLMLTQSTKHKRRSYWRRVIDASIIPGKMWAVLLLLAPLSAVLAVFFSLPLGHSLSQFALLPTIMAQPLKIFGFLSVLLLMGPISEELGWRGYWLESLGKQFNLFTTSLIIAVTWVLWHFPLFHIAGSPLAGLSSDPLRMVVFLGRVLPISILFTWVYCCSNRSILAAILFHLTINFTGSIIHIDSVSKFIEMLLLNLIAGIVLLKKRELFFSPPQALDAKMKQQTV